MKEEIVNWRELVKALIGAYKYKADDEFERLIELATLLDKHL